MESASHYVDAPLNAESLALAVLAGMAITLMTRMQHGTDSMPAKIAAAVAGAFLLAGLQMFHSILDSLLIFGALLSGGTPFGYADWLSWFGYTVVGNIVGGLGLVTLASTVAQQGPFAGGTQRRGSVLAAERNFRPGRVWHPRPRVIGRDHTPTSRER